MICFSHKLDGIPDKHMCSQLFRYIIENIYHQTILFCETDLIFLSARDEMREGNYSKHIICNSPVTFCR